MTSIERALDSDRPAIERLLSDAGLPLELTVLVKCAAHWAASTAPLAILSPLFGLMLGMDAAQLALVAVSLVAGTPALTMIGAIGAALTVSLRRGGLLMAVLVLPLAIPVLIFGVSAASAASGGAAPLAAPLQSTPVTTPTTTPTRTSAGRGDRGLEGSMTPV